jgi:hypothetical protein
MQNVQPKLDEKQPLTIGAIIGISIGAIVGSGLLILFIYWFIKGLRLRSDENEESLISAKEWDQKYDIQKFRKLHD